MTENRQSIVTRDTLKYIAIICMTFDHIGWVFLNFTTPTAQIFHFFGRFTAPIMCFFIAEGYHYTRDVKKYLTRLLIFAVVSEVPFVLLGYWELDMMFTLALGLLAIIIYEKEDWDKLKKAILIALILFVSLFCDWLIFGVLWVLFFHIFREDNLKKFLAFSGVWVLYLGYTVMINISDMGITGVKDNIIYALYALGCFGSYALIKFLYNGNKGHFRVSKWIFYVYYPLHLLVLWILHTYVIV